MRFEQWPWLTYLRLLITHQTLSNVVISNQSWGFIQHWLFRNPPSACCCFAAALASPLPCLSDCVLCLLELLPAPKAPSEQPQPISGGPSWNQGLRARPSAYNSNPPPPILTSPNPTAVCNRSGDTAPTSSRTQALVPFVNTLVCGVCLGWLVA
ncbi:hypothetical protein CGCSCA1_v009765 [Colletotrichum siamense]|nr:hypothetical protein CGCSCA1_v009765 [Colletotrichum siamense]